LALAALGPAAAAPGVAGPQDMSLGNPRARVKVVEYASVTCPHCGRFNNDVFPQFKAKYIDTGKVLYVFREFPTDPAQVAAAGFLVARCAGKDKYLAVIDALFHGQEKLYESQDAKAWLVEAGKAGGLNEAQVQACVQDEKALKAFNDRVEAAFNVAKIQSTPTFLIGSTRVSGEQSLDQLSKVIDPMLAAK
jgi:protein-disulfide isomerase